MATNDEIFDQLNLSDTDREWVLEQAAQMNKKGFNSYSNDPEASNLLTAIDGVSTNINSSLSSTSSERSDGRKGGYGTEGYGAVAVSDLSSEGITHQEFDCKKGIL
ncbi:MAG: hypothetical protein H8E12_01705 [Rhodobacteraceae bacterium]|nr:hypothetical protein [Paracoccaceae bacterium]